MDRQYCYLASGQRLPTTRYPTRVYPRFDSWPTTGAASVADPHHFNAIPDPAFHFNADPDPAFHFNADPNQDPTPHQSTGNIRPLNYIP